jgi:ribonuclease P/MRP protein subunit RPP40
MLEMKPPPESKSKHDDEFETFATETHEWLSLVSLNSPRIDPEDRIDSILSRYIPPGESLTSSQLVKITWGGFISPSWAHKTFIQTLLASPKNSWFSYSACGFGNGSSQHSKDCTILKLPDCQNEYLLWEVE